MQNSTPSYTPKQALQKIQAFCSYQERCHYEVMQKLYEWGLHKLEVEDIICQLIQDDFLNEERFAIQFAGGKHRAKQWGKIKIGYELKAKKISEYLIKKALNSIEDDDYEKALQSLAIKQFKQIKGATIFIKKQKLKLFLQQKGYELVLIQQLLNSEAYL